MRRNFSYTLLITWILFVISCKTNITPTSFNAQNISVSPEMAMLDSQIVAIYHPFKKILDKEMNRVISISELEMIKKRPESYLTNFLADLLLEEAVAYSETSGTNIKPDIAYFNNGGIRTSLPRGEITVGKIYELMPFENEMVILKLTGSQIIEFLNYVAKKGGESVGGVRFKISGEHAKNITIHGKPVNQELEYWLVTNDYVADGGDGLSVFTQSPEVIKTGRKIRDVLISHLEKKHNNKEKLKAVMDGRITYE